MQGRFPATATSVTTINHMEPGSPTSGDLRHQDHAALTYRELLLILELELGTQHILVNRNAKEPGNILLPTGVHDALLGKLTKAIYKKSQCYHIKAPVLPAVALSALQSCREERLLSEQTDWDTVRLLDQIYWLFTELFGRAQPATNPERTSAKLLLFRRTQAKQG